MNKTAMKTFFDDDIDDRDKNEILLYNMLFLKNLDVKEYTLYKKWYELQNYREQHINAIHIKDKIWKPTDINNEKLTIQEINELQPELILVDNDSIYKDNWLLLRVFGHTMEFDVNPWQTICTLLDRSIIFGHYNLYIFLESCLYRYSDNVQGLITKKSKFEYNALNEDHIKIFEDIKNNPLFEHCLEMFNIAKN